MSVRTSTKTTTTCTTAVSNEPLTIGYHINNGISENLNSLSGKQIAFLPQPIIALIKRSMLQIYSDARNASKCTFPVHSYNVIER